MNEGQQICSDLGNGRRPWRRNFNFRHDCDAGSAVVRPWAKMVAASLEPACNFRRIQSEEERLSAPDIRVNNVCAAASFTKWDETARTRRRGSSGGA